MKRIITAIILFMWGAVPVPCQSMGILLEEAPDYLLHGHTHCRRDERLDGTRVINPGALGGVQYESRSLCVLDLDTDDLDVIILD